MTLKHLSDQTLLKNTAALARQERELLTEILHHLREIEQRRLFSSVGCKSLYDYCVRVLGYSGDQAGRRIAAMRLLQDLPQIESKIQDGSLSLTNLSMAQVLFRKEAVEPSRKAAILASLEKKTTREAEKIILSQAAHPLALKPDRIRAVSEDQIEIRFIASEQLNQKLTKLKGLLAHSHPRATLAELIDHLCDISLGHLLKRRLGSDGASASASKSPGAPKGQCVTGRRYLPSWMRRQVWQQAQGQCQNCGSEHALEVDHIHPLATGGTNELRNLRLLCRSCNQRAAIMKLGYDRMETHLRGRKSTEPR